MHGLQSTLRRLATTAATLLVLASPVAVATSASADSGPVPSFKTRPLCIFYNQAVSCYMQGTATGGSRIVSWDWEYPGVSGNHASGQYPVLRLANLNPVDVTLTVVDDQDRTGTVTKQITIQLGAWPSRAP
jgi:hypothetical protein